MFQRAPRPTFISGVFPRALMRFGVFASNSSYLSGESLLKISLLQLHGRKKKEQHRNMVNKNFI